MVLQTPTLTRPDSSHSATDFRDIVLEQQSLVALGGHRQDMFAVGLGDARMQQVEGSWVTAPFFDVFEVPADFEALVGQSVSVNGVAHEVVGAIIDNR